MKLVTAAQMRAIEQAAIDSGAVTGLELMERAGRGVVDAIFDKWPEKAASPAKAIMLCGPGNNGGDGFVVARLLAEKGWTVEVYLYGDEAKLPPDAAENCRRWREMGDVRPITAITADGLYMSDYAVVIDALFGTGARRPLPSEVAALVPASRRYDPAHHGPSLVSVDIPSGLDSDSGKIIGDSAFWADLTVTFGWRKPAHFLAEGAALCGDVSTIPLGISDRAGVQTLAKHHGLPSRRGVGRFITSLAESWDAAEKPGGHKYNHGHVLVLSGGVGKGGAARLAARGALRIGAGAVTVGAPPSALIENAAQLNAIMLQRIENADGLTQALADTRKNTLVVGPGLGVGERTLGLVIAALSSEVNRGFVLDADALTSFEKDTEALFALTRGTKTVLTPHMGEFGRLFPDVHAELTASAGSGPAFSKVDAVRAAAERAGCVVLLKGPDTVIADDTGSAKIVAAVRERSCPWLATAGAGDVLAGYIAGLMARGFSALQSAEIGAYLHQECALSFGPGLIAEDLPEELPKVLRRLSQSREEKPASF